MNKKIEEGPEKHSMATKNQKTKEKEKFSIKDWKKTKEKEKFPIEDRKKKKINIQKGLRTRQYLNCHKQIRKERKPQLEVVLSL